jgi:hypothetical protein
MSRDIHRRRLPLLSAVVAVVAATVLSATPALSAPPPGPTANGDVYIRDQASDFGFEPSSGSVWSSPDIWVCEMNDLLMNGPTGCTSVNPLIPGNNYVVAVRMNNPAPTVPVGGDLHVYWSALGGGALWPGDWTEIGAVYGLSVPGGGTIGLIPWYAADLPTVVTHFCLLARWVSGSDPMTVAELPNSNTVYNTQQNNNIAWHNMDILNLKKFDRYVVPFVLRKPIPDPRTLLTNLVLTQPKPFAGRLTVDLGPTLAARWRQNGQRGVGVRPVGETQVEVVDPRQATIIGLPINTDERFETRMTFQSTDVAGQFQLRAFQTDAQGVDLGGAQFDVTVR